MTLKQTARIYFRKPTVTSELPLVNMSKIPVPEALLEQKYPAKAHARKAAKWLKENGGSDKGVIYLEGQKDKLIEVRYSAQCISS